MFMNVFMKYGNAFIHRNYMSCKFSECFDCHLSSSSKQALIAEKIGSYDTMDLFRHTTELSSHVRDLSYRHRLLMQYPLIKTLLLY